ncbi:unnamed protein product [Amoebophrya sp. A25]|nr:unnamed protein product [Amoebophrya sp. A25]|eukprot:GSA25T00015941001.1
MAVDDGDQPERCSASASSTGRRSTAQLTRKQRPHRSIAFLLFGSSVAAISDRDTDLSCKGTQKEYAECEVEPCGRDPCMDCVWSEWAPLSACSCEGLRERHRVIAQQSNSCGKPCEGPKVETVRCIPDCHKTPIDCQLSAWSSWGRCSKDCGGGQRNRTRTVEVEAAHDGKTCDGALSEVEPCNTAPCEAPVDCVLGEWSSWDYCSEECGGGQTTRTRVVQTVAKSGGLPCTGGLIETKDCNTQVCEVDRDCVWDEWQEWSTCSRTCGIGTKGRERMIKHAPRGQGALCEPRDMAEMEKCDMGLCHAAVDCVFESWSPWGECSASCHGVQQRTRHIAATPKYGGAACEGSLTEMQGCNNAECFEGDAHRNDPVDCVLSYWKDWSECSVSCGGGTRTRSRRIVTPSAHDGEACNGALSEVEPCNVEICPKDVVPVVEAVDCAWAQWEEWGECSASCGVGQKFRTRKIAQEASMTGNACDPNAAMEVTQCKLKPCVAVDCLWSEWSSWSDCTCSCLQERHREIAQHFAGEGKPCDGPKVETQHCDAHCEAEPIDCELSSWSHWTACSEPCGGGQQERTRKVLVHPEYGGKSCDGGLEEMKACNTETCEKSVDCVVAEWSDWGDCSATCGGGEQHRGRKISREAKNGGAPCQDELSQVRGCGKTPCQTPVDCVWGEWSAFDECSKTCGGGQKTRTRHVTTSPRLGGKLCEPLTSAEVVPCATESCDAGTTCRNGKWGEWSNWSMCSTTCGEGYQFRHRQVASEPNACGEPVTGKHEELQVCNMGQCDNGPVDCEFGDWSSWEPCSSKCNGVHERMRLVTVYSKNNGVPCSGATKQIGPCNTGSNCEYKEPVDCVLGEWGLWTECTAECETGTSTRKRKIDQYPLRGGKTCEGSLQEVKTCNEQRCETSHDCKWSVWGEWGSCDKHCGGGERTRFRHIVKNPKRMGTPCDRKEASEIEACNTTPCGHIEYCVWNEWSVWSSCSKTCGQGTKHRKRALTISADASTAETALSSGVFAELFPGNSILGGTGRFSADHVALTFVGGMVSSTLALFAIYTGLRRSRSSRFAPLEDEDLVIE